MRVRLLLALAALVLVGGTANLARRVLAPVPSDGVRWEATGQGLLARDVPTHVVGVVPGDRLIAIDGQPVTSSIDLLLLDRAALPGSERRYVLERAGEAVEAAVAVARGAAPRGYLLLALSGLLGLVAAQRILRAASAEPGAAPAAVAAIAFSAMALASPCGWMDGWDRLALSVDELARLAFPAALLHSVLALGGVALGATALAIWAPPLVLALANAAWLLAAPALNPPGVVRLGGWLDRAASLELAVGVGLAVLTAIALWLRAGAVAREPLRRLLRGALVGVLPYVVLVALPRAAGYRSLFLADAALLFLPALPFALLDAVPGARLGVREIARSGLTLGSALLLAVGLAIATVEVATGLLPPLGLPAWVAYLAAGAVLALGSFERVRASLESAIESRVDREGYEARRTLLAFGRELAVETRIHALADSLVVRVLRAFSMRRAALYALGPGADLEQVGTRIADGACPERIPLAALEDLVPAAGKVVPLERPWAAPLRAAGLDLAVPLVSRGRLCGLLVLSQPAALRFGRRERRLLADLCGYVAVALDHAMLLDRALLQAEEIRELEQFRLSVVESLGIGLAILDLEGRILSTNRSFRELIGAAPPARSAARDVLPAELLDPPAAGVVERRALGERTLAVSTKLLLRGDGSVQGRILVAEDVTERVAEEVDRIRREKLATVGLLAAGVAHEINTPLAGIASYVQMLVETTAADDPRKLLLDKVEKQSFRAARMVRSLLNFARASDEREAPFAIETVVGEALGLLEHSLRRGRVRVELAIPPDLPEALGRAGEIEQVTLNLVKNAVEAMPEGGVLRIVAGAEDEQVWFRVEDTGHGMDVGTRERLFEPFFTTKERGRGHGLGLAVSLGIVEAHEGRLEVESSPGRGTRMMVWLPAAVAVESRSELRAAAESGR